MPRSPASADESRRSGILTGARIALLFTRGHFTHSQRVITGTRVAEVARLLGRHRGAMDRDLELLAKAGFLSRLTMSSGWKSYSLAGDPFACLPAGWEQRLPPGCDEATGACGPIDRFGGKTRAEYEAEIATLSAALEEALGEDEDEDEEGLVRLRGVDTLPTPKSR